MWSTDWIAVSRIVGTGAAVYIGLVILLRWSGKRTLTKWNSFDLIVTISLGSTLATALLSSEVTVIEGLAGLSVLILLQFVVTWFQVRVPWFHDLVKSRPSALLIDGEMQEEALLRERVSASEVRAAVRASGHASLREVGFVILETDGELSVIPPARGSDQSALRDVVIDREKE